MNLAVKLILAILGVGASVYILVCLALVRWQNRLIFFPITTIDITPSDLGISYEDVWIGKVHAWWLESQKNDTKVLLYLHGNGSNVSGNLRHAARFHKLGFSVLLIDYRGYGFSSSAEFPTEASVYEDTLAAWNYLVTTKGIKPSNIIIYGHSLGGAIAIELATHQPEAGGLILEGTFSSIRDMVSIDPILRFFPVDLVLHQRFDSISKIKSLKMPILFIHGTEDEVVPAFMSQRLYDVTNAPKKLVLIPSAGHNNVASVAEEKYLQAVKDFYMMILK